MKLLNKKLALFLSIAFLIGLMFGSIGNKTKTEVREVVKNEIHWKDLKQLDDKIFVNLDKTVSACASNDSGRYDILTEDYEFLLSERELVLKKLGY